MRKEATRRLPNMCVIAVALYMLLGVGVASAATKTVTLRVTGMTCESCAHKIEEALKTVDGVLAARVSYERSQAWIKYDDKKVTVAKLRDIIKGVGYGVEEGKSETKARRSRKSIAGVPRPIKNYSTSLSELREDFNSDRGYVRLIMLLSPT